MPDVAELLAKVRTTADRRAAELEAEWWKQVKAAGAGEEVDPERVVVLLADTGRDAAAFAAAVELQVRRHGWAADLAAEAAGEKRRAGALAALKKLADQFERAEAKYEADRAPHLAEVAAADDAGIRAMTARRDLLVTCPYPDRKARLAAADAAVTAADGRLRSARDRLSQVQTAADLPASRNMIDYRGAIAKAKARLPQIEAEVAALAAERAAALAEVAAATEAMRQP